MIQFNPNNLGATTSFGAITRYKKINFQNGIPQKIKTLAKEPRFKEELAKLKPNEKIFLRGEEKTVNGEKETVIIGHYLDGETIFASSIKTVDDLLRITVGAYKNFTKNTTFHIAQPKNMFRGYGIHKSTIQYNGTPIE